MVKIKKLYQGTRVAFGASGFPLNKRTPEEIIDLAIMAQESKNPNLLVMFEDELPTVDELKKMKAGIRLKQTRQTLKQGQNNGFKTTKSGS